MDPDGTIQKEAFFEPLNDEEKFSLEPEHFRPEHIIMRRMMRDGIQPDDRNLLRIAKSYGYIPTAEDLKAKSLAKAPKAKKAHISKRKTKRRDLASADKQAAQRKAKGLAKAKKAKKAHISKHKTKRRDLASAALKRHCKKAGNLKPANKS